MLEAAQLSSVLRHQADHLLADPPPDRDPEQQFGRICRGLVEVVPTAKWAAMTTHDQDGLRCHGATDDRLPELTTLMARSEHGPCVDVITIGTAEEIVVDDLATAGDRWPVVAPAAVESGMRSVICYAMAPDEDPIGTLSAWSDEVGAFRDRTARVIMVAFAAQAAIAVYGARRAAHLLRALATRDVIGRAKGILMERFSMTDTDAFQLLVRSSQEMNMKVHDVAEVLCHQVETRSTTAS